MFVRIETLKDMTSGTHRRLSFGYGPHTQMDDGMYAGGAPLSMTELASLSDSLIQYRNMANFFDNVGSVWQVELDK